MSDWCKVKIVQFVETKSASVISKITKLNYGQVFGGVESRKISKEN
jgi:hypothetical protein